MKNPKIYTDSYQLAVMVFHRTKSYPKFLRNTLARRSEESTLDLLAAVRIAMMGKGPRKKEALLQASDHLDNLRILFQLAKDIQAISVGSYAEFSELTSTIGKEVGGFLKYVENRS